ncbi:BTAD domain-containing putative transcriptional regulator [Amycolatopsis sp. DG1A-15b]|uniref:AfsR/SARP family transcriptional regulator n=1 Tax=Amycolatopsis sp. DG1A-15b TaxID=3052846 RepID=UPI00255B83BD|nr:BTAD domain-containing putative transcriptional regulator [Amycolatopsis sp. DG1A-15b]WIX90427.1 BTAD domain-containing putative transcriptional regulator [Amycolatopsis sp. DG1A-15b]
MLEIRLLGEVCLLVDGRVVDLGPAKQRCVLAALALDAGHVVSVDRLMQRVWGAQFPLRARPTLLNYISRLRKVLPAKESVEIGRRPGGYLLRAPEGAVDVLRFRELCERGRGPGLDDHRADLLTQALRLWRGEALTGISGSWAEGERDRLRLDRLTTECDLTDILLGLGQGESLVAGLAARVAEHPLDERVAGQYLLSLGAAGRAADALDHYRLLRARLVAELGTDPGPPLQAIHRRILTAEPVSPPRPDRSTGRPVLRPRQLPAPPPLFTGRTHDLESLTAVLDSPARAGTGVAIAVLSGAGGIGKTWLALHWAHRHLDRFPDGQLFVDLRGFGPAGRPMPIGAAVRGLLDAFGVAPSDVPVELHAQSALLRSLTAGKRLLIVLDNAADTQQVAPLLPGGPGCTVLVTSRQRLPGLVAGHGAHPLALDVITDAEARALLTARLGAEKIAAEPDAAEELLACCGGFPLALSIVAGRALAHPGLPLAQLAAELSEAGPAGLDEGDPATDLSAVLSWSYRALDEDQARMFALLGIAPGPDISAAAAACLTGLPRSPARALLRSLEQASLVTRDRHDRFHMHDLVRRYATDRAAVDLPDTERSAALRRLVGLLLHTAHAAERLLYPQRPPIELTDPEPEDGFHPPAGHAAALAWFDREHRCLVAAQRAASARGWDATTWQLAWALTTFHSRRGLLHDDYRTWQVAKAAADRLDDTAAQAQAYRNLGRACIWLNRPDEALEHLRQALALAERTHDDYEQAHTHRNLAQVRGITGDHRRARHHAVHALHLFRGTGNPAGEADAHNQVGWYSARLGEQDAARAHCEEALALHQRHHDREGEAVALHSLGYVAHHSDRFADAVNYYQLALLLFRAVGNTYLEAGTLDDLGSAYAALSDHERARVKWRRALALYQAQHRAGDAARARQQLSSLAGPPDRRAGSLSVTAAGKTSDLRIL